MVEEVTTTVRHFEIEVNKFKFTETHEERTGLQIKQDAIAAGAPIKVTYVLDLQREGGSIRISDDTVVKIHSGERFLAHPGGSDS